MFILLLVLYKPLALLKTSNSSGKSLKFAELCKL